MGLEAVLQLTHQHDGRLLCSVALETREEQSS